MYLFSLRNIAFIYLFFTMTSERGQAISDAPAVTGLKQQPVLFNN